MKKIVFTLFLLVFLVLGLFYFARERIFAPSGTNGPTTFLVKNGHATSRIGNELEVRGLVSSGKLFSWWCRYQKASPKAGWYDIPEKASIAEIAKILSAGKTAVRKVTIPEGRASWEMPAYFRKAIPDFDSTRWEAIVNDPEFARELGIEAKSLEGYLLPDTYPIEIGATEKDIAKQMVRANRRLRDEMEAKKSPLWKELGGWHKVLTLASVVEEETGKTDERQLIAGVFINRLRQGIPLGADPTVRFIFRNLTGPIYKSELQSESPYNTRRFPGLMPGPISNPGRKAVEAVLYPKDTDALYFVAKDDGSGTHFFARSLSEHNRYKSTAARNRGE